MLVVASGLLFTQCTSDDEQDTTESVLEVDNNGYSQFNGNALQAELNRLPKEDLSTAEETGLLFMREEEKLAHDVYIQLYEKWNKKVFDNIAASELTHASSVNLLLIKYELVDPVGSNTVGVFTNSTIQQLHDDLIESGVVSTIDALKVGAAIEEIDILDLEVQLTEVVDNQDIRMVYENLQKGSRNHLRAYARNLSNSGISYQPQYLTQTMFDQIINGEMETNN